MGALGATWCRWISMDPCGVLLYVSANFCINPRDQPPSPRRHIASMPKHTMVTRVASIQVCVRTSHISGQIDGAQFGSHIGGLLGYEIEGAPFGSHISV